ncbi:unnamed protein product [Anisakis simplex]|uniref:tRNA pseudouridine synthase n=1 Tax=Anisakis simplex TaxID=6269 RepID=A0A0M3IY13_ANISI|nr:unnamed protein product [Anisakis simplex]
MVVMDSFGSNETRRTVKEQREFDFSRYPKRRIALMFLYYGWQYDGLVQQQDTLNTVEEVIKNALLKVRLIESWKTCEWSRSGRTDKGVSAFKQIASLVVRSNDPNDEFVFWPDDKADDSSIAVSSRISPPYKELSYTKMLNAVLPNNIRVLAWAPISSDFSARFSCTKRVYKYAFPRADFNVYAIQEACKLLVGEHDFRNFCRIDLNKARVEMSYVRNVFEAYISIVCNDGSRVRVYENKEFQNCGPYSMVEFTMVGSGFLWHQIRCIMAVIYEIGKENEKPEVISELLDIKSTPRKPAYGLVPPSPLCLFECSYGNEDIRWMWDIDCVRKIKSQLLITLADLQAKCMILRNMVTGIEQMVPELETNIEGLGDFMKPNGQCGSSYTRLKERPTCDALEEKREKVRAKAKKFEEMKIVKRRKVDDTESTP